MSQSAQALKVIILDFDGVLIDSVGIKDRAFAKVFSNYPEHLSEIMDYHRSAALIRFEKFRYIYMNILKEPYTDEIRDRCAKTFSEFSVVESIRCPWVPGAREFLEHFAGKIPMYLASINPPEDLKTILVALGISHFFQGVMTTAGSKAGVIKDIVSREHAGPHQAIFIGDSPADYDSSCDAGVSFIGRDSGLWSGKETFSIYRDMFCILEVVKGWARS